MRLTVLALLPLCIGLTSIACSEAASDSLDEDPGAAGSAGAAGGGGAPAGQGGSGGSTAGSSAAGGSAAGGSAAGGGGKAGAAGEGSAGDGGAAGEAQAGQGGSEAGGQGGSAGQGGGPPFGGSAGVAGESGAGGSAAGASGAGGSSAGTGGSGGSGGAGGSAPAGWTCSASLYGAGGDLPACNCDCGAYDPDCDDPMSHVKGCGTGQTCGKDGTCQGEVLFPPDSWVCGSAYYGIGGPKPVCNCGCGAPDPDCDVPYPTMDLTKCKTGQTCGKDGTCQGPELSVPGTWTCKPSKFAEGKTSGTCDCGCGAPDPDCADVHLKLTGCGYKQTCEAGQCTGPIAPAPDGWGCDGAAYSDGKLCNCACGIRDPDCDLADLPDDCGPDAFCGSIKNECIPKAN